MYPDLVALVALIGLAFRSCPGNYSFTARRKCSLEELFEMSQRTMRLRELEEEDGQVARSKTRTWPDAFGDYLLIRRRRCPNQVKVR